MQRSYSLAEVANPVEMLRKAGYSYFRDPQSGEESFVIRLSTEFYPRFHLYVEPHGDKVTFNLHLDQKKPSYGEGNKHAGEYDGPTVEKEMSRIDSWVRAANKPSVDTAEHDIDIQNQAQQKRLGETLKRWWQNLFPKN